MSDCPTAEAILSLPAGAEADALIAERVFGGKVVYNALTGRVQMARLGGVEADYDELPRFSADTAAAFRVIEHLSAGGKCVAFARREGWGWQAGFDEVRCEAETLPLAVCRAALLWTTTKGGQG